MPRLYGGRRQTSASFSIDLIGGIAMKKCLNCGSNEMVDVNVSGYGFNLSKSDGFVDTLKQEPVKSFACAVCGHVQLFANVATLKQWAQKG
jgi:transcription elongation factor Elf1